MSGSLGTVSDLFDAVKASVDELVTALSYEQFHPVRVVVAQSSGTGGRLADLV